MGRCPFLLCVYKILSILRFICLYHKMDYRVSPFDITPPRLARLSPPRFDKDAVYRSDLSPDLLLLHSLRHLSIFRTLDIPFFHLLLPFSYTRTRSSPHFRYPIKSLPLLWPEPKNCPDVSSLIGPSIFVGIHFFFTSPPADSSPTCFDTRYYSFFFSSRYFSLLKTQV